MYEAVADAPQAELLAGVLYVADVLTGLWLEREWSADEVGRLIEQSAELLDTTPAALAVAIFVRALREDNVLELPPRLAIETQLRMLRAFTGIETASLWVHEPGTRATSLVHVGDGEPSRSVRATARAVLRGDTARDGDRTLLRGYSIDRWEQPYAALVVKCTSESKPFAPLLAAEAAATAGRLLEVDALLERSAEKERSLVEASERRLVRVGFDLHDGPMQDLVALAHEVQHFRSQLVELLGDDERAQLVIGRVDDVDARLRAVDGDLRELARSLNAPAVLRTPFEELLWTEVRGLEDRTGLSVALETRGDFEALTSSARIALLRVVQEALANAQRHSAASTVRVDATIRRGRANVTIEDDGGGFEVEQTLVAAARAGRLGLVGMGERIRLLGGRFDVRSQPGGPTVVMATLPVWRPPTPSSSNGT
jgi:signal transduction histidine kinase